MSNVLANIEVVILNVNVWEYEGTLVYMWQTDFCSRVIKVTFGKEEDPSPERQQ